MNEQSDIPLPADGQHEISTFPTPTLMGNVSINTEEAVGAVREA